MGCTEPPRGFSQAAEQKAACPPQHPRSCCCFTCCPLSVTSLFANDSAGTTLTAPPLCLASHLRGSWLPLMCSLSHTYGRGPSRPAGSGDSCCVEGQLWRGGGAAFPLPLPQNGASPAGGIVSLFGSLLPLQAGNKRGVFVSVADGLLVLGQFVLIFSFIRKFHCLHEARLH